MNKVKKLHLTFKLIVTKTLQAYLNKEKITYEIYQEKRVFKEYKKILTKNQAKEEN